MARSVPPIAATLIGSDPQPDWLIDRERLRGSLPARVRDAQLWRVPEPFLRQAQDDATALAIRDFERVGIDILADGEIRRESYSNRFATALEGWTSSTRPWCPAAPAASMRSRAWSVGCGARDRSRSRTWSLPGPRPTAAINRAFEGASGPTVLHTCFGYAHVVHERPPGYPFLAELADCAADGIAIEAAQPRLDPQVLAPIARKTVIVGVLDLSDDAPVETPDQVAQRIERALAVVPAERLQVGPDCGMKYLSRDVAFAKLCALVEGAAMVRARL